MEVVLKENLEVVYPETVQYTYNRKNDFESCLNLCLSLKSRNPCLQYMAEAGAQIC